MVSLTSVVRTAPGVEVTEIQGETVVLDPSGRKIRGFNPSAAYLWRRLDGRSTVGALAVALTEEFDVELAAAEEAALTFVRELVALGLVVATAA